MSAVAPPKPRSAVPNARHSREGGNPASFARYPKYKDSGVVWLGNVPAHWGVMKLKWIAHLRSGETIAPNQIGDSGEFPVFGGNGLRGYTAAYTHEGDYALVGRQGALCGNINYASGKFWASEHAVVATPRDGVCTRWLGEMLRSMNLNQYSTSAAQPGLSVEVISNVLIAAPPRDEQQTIATFLDRETAKIDALIAEQEKLIALLKEKRQALISHAVTKGLDPNVPMKDSGIEWLGQVPAHWDVLRNKVLFKEVDTRTSTGEGELLTVSHLTGITKRSEKNVNMIMAETLDGYKECLIGDLVINTMWGWMGALGTSPLDGLVSPSYNVYRIRDQGRLLPKYYDYLCRIPSHVTAIKANSTGVWESRLRLYPQAFLSIFTCVPPTDEQVSICDFLELETGKYDGLVEGAEHAIELLEERRAALISAAVTGKIDVRGAAEVLGTRRDT